MLLPSPTPNTEGKLVSASSVFTTGIFIKSVVVDSPAARTGMATGDRIVQVGGRGQKILVLQTDPSLKLYNHGEGPF